MKFGGNRFGMSKRIAFTQTHTDIGTHIDKGPETGGFSHVLGVVGIISIFMY